MAVLLDVKDLTTRFKTTGGTVQAVNGISYTLNEGEIIGIVGESGCGKSVSMRSVMRIIPEPPGRIEKGEVFFKGRDLLNLNHEEMRKIRGKEIAMIFQDPMSSLNPVLTIGKQITETIIEHEGVSRQEALERAEELLNLVGIPNARQRLNEYPHQYSGGMRQRAMIAMCLSCNPSLLIADEPTTALDVTIQMQITDLVQKLQNEMGMAVIWITHDLGVVARLVERVMVMYAGYIVENARVKDLYGNTGHPYTMGLLESLPRLDEGEHIRLRSIPGQPPDQLHLPDGCPFAERCQFKTERCLEENPQLEEHGDGHWVACWEKDNIKG